MNILSAEREQTAVHFWANQNADPFFPYTFHFSQLRNVLLQTNQNTHTQKKIVLAYKNEEVIQ